MKLKKQERTFQKKPQIDEMISLNKERAIQENVNYDSFRSPRDAWDAVARLVYLYRNAWGRA